MLTDFVECVASAIAGINGNGSVTLSRFNGLPLPGDLWGSSPVDVDYLITDVQTSPLVPLLEKGRGNVSFGVLARSTPRLTWNGSVFDETTPAPLAFGAAPILGFVRVQIGPSADLFVQSAPGIYVGGGGALAGWSPTGNLSGPPGITAGAGLTLTANREYYSPFLCPFRGPCGGMGIYVTTPVAAANVKLGVYDVGADGLPGNCIARSGAVAAATAGLKTDVSPGSWLTRAGPLAFRPGWLYVGFISDQAIEVGCTSRASLAGMTPLGQLDAYGWGAVVYRNSSNTYATGLPSGRPDSSGGYTNAAAVSNSVPSIFLQIGN